MTPTYLLVSEKPWHDSLLNELVATVPGNWVRINTKEQFEAERIATLNPTWIFIPHWSYLIPKKIYDHYRCVVFHMTDLPYGRGGSPLQNLISLGHKETKISAIKVEREIDAGDVYLKKPLSLEGTAKEIFIAASTIIGDMIKYLVEHEPQPVPQLGEPVFFKRRTPEESDIKNLSSLEKVYDYIRMLDCDGYPHAYLQTEHLTFEFTEAFINDDQSITANVRITKK